jgi:hypothetical protein
MIDTKRQDDLVESWIKANRPGEVVTVDSCEELAESDALGYELTDGTLLLVTETEVTAEKGLNRSPTIEEMTEGELVNVYRERFGAGALPHMFLLPPEEMEQVMERMREALRTGKPIPPDLGSCPPTAP